MKGTEPEIFLSYILIRTIEIAQWMAVVPSLTEEVICRSISLFVMCMILLRPDNVLCMRLGTTIKKKARTMVK